MKWTLYWIVVLVPLMPLLEQKEAATLVGLCLPPLIYLSRATWRRWCSARPSPRARFEASSPASDEETVFSLRAPGFFPPR